MRGGRGWWLAALRMGAATVGTGLAAGLLGALLSLLLHAVQHLAYGYSEGSFLIGAEHAAPWRRVAALGIGGLVVGVGWSMLRRRHGADTLSVPQAIDRREPRLPLAAGFIDAILQIVAVGAGASLGREGAPRQAGAAAAGWISSRAGLDLRRRTVLFACGAGAGLAAVYNVPFGGAVFTLEILLSSLAFDAVVPALLTSGIATVVAWPIVGNLPTYPLGPVSLHAPVLVWAVVVGPVAGLVGTAFTAVTNYARRFSPTGWWIALTVPLAFGALGALAAVYPELLGNGKGPAALAFAGILGVGLAAVLVVLKPLATAGCLLGGAQGGLLTPALATGAALGVVTGGLWDRIWPGATLTEFAIVGAATMLATTQRAPLTAIVLTLDFIGSGQHLLAPLLIAVSGALVTTHFLGRRAARQDHPGVGETQPSLTGNA